ncbi:MAG: alpha/beta hydrolase [Nocardioidaceae bacterium]
MALRVGFRLAELVAPRVGGRLATDLWFRIPPASPVGDLPPGGVPFEVASQGGVVRGHSWGTGPVVYLMHGWGGRGDQLAPFVEPLVARGHQVVTFDAPSHGASDAGPSGAGRAHGAEFGRAFDAVAARFGPAHAVIAHSMGAVPSLLTLHYGWLSTQRLVLLAPMASLATHFDAFGSMVGFGARVRHRLEQVVAERTGLPVDEFDVRRLAARLEQEDGELPPLLVVHDTRDRETSYDESVSLVDHWPDARLVTTQGLGHRRLLRDAGVVRVVTQFVVTPAESLRESVA